MKSIVPCSLTGSGTAGCVMAGLYPNGSRMRHAVWHVSSRSLKNGYSDISASISMNIFSDDLLLSNQIVAIKLLQSLMALNGVPCVRKIVLTFVASEYVVLY